MWTCLRSQARDLMGACGLEEWTGRAKAQAIPTLSEAGVCFVLRDRAERTGVTAGGVGDVLSQSLLAQEAVGVGLWFLF